MRRHSDVYPIHLIIGIADHFEPSFHPNLLGSYVSRAEQEQRLERWCRLYPTVFEQWVDDDGRPLRHSYFFPAEQYDPALIDRLSEHCHAGWGEIEIHLHHGVEKPDTEENTRQKLIEFRDALADRGCLSRLDGEGSPRYAFVHGNWALANSAQGRCCGVDNEMQILAETGCYADFTLPSAPSSAQMSKINSLYECSKPLYRRAPHRKGRNLQCGLPPDSFPLIVQGPLLLNWGARKRGWSFPRIENSELTSRNPPSMQRLRLWQDAGIAVRGCPNWLFIKLHCHGMDPRDESVMLGEPIQRFLQELLGQPQRKEKYRVHFVTAREMVNVILAACDGHSGDPGQYRDYRLRLITACSEKNLATSAFRTKVS
jgi:hypothetical protein